MNCPKGLINRRGDAGGAFTASGAGWLSPAAVASSADAGPKGGNALRYEKALAGGRERRFKLPRTARMRRRRDFARTVREGRAAAREAFVIHCLSVPGEGRLLGVVCGRRVGGAVIRNRVKRRLREIFRTHPEYFRDGFWFVAVAKPAIVDKDFQTLREEVTAALAGLTGGTYEKKSARD